MSRISVRGRSSKTFPQSTCFLDRPQLLKHVLILPQFCLLLLVGLLHDIFLLFLKIFDAIVQFLGVLQQLILGLCPNLSLFESYIVDLVHKFVLLVLCPVQ